MQDHFPPNKKPQTMTHKAYHHIIYLQPISHIILTTITLFLHSNLFKQNRKSFSKLLRVTNLISPGSKKRKTMMSSHLS